MAVDLSQGVELAGFRIEALIGRGGMGVVYRAIDIRLDRTVALKLIAPELAGQEAFRRRFLREAKIAASLEHAHVLPVYEAGEEDGLLFMAVRYVEGEDLAALIARGPLSPERTCRIVFQLASALQAAHERGLVHRDVKPANVLVLGHEGEEHAYLTDFGLAKPAASRSGVTRTGEIVGTVDYMAPEQIQYGTSDARSDVYALGCVLYQALTGQVPFVRETEAAKLWAHMNDEPPSALGLRPELPRSLDAAIRRAMATDPNERYASAGEMGVAVQTAIDGVAGRALARRRLTLRAGTPHARYRRVFGRHRRLLVVGLVGLAALSTGLIVLVGRSETAKALAAVDANAVGVLDASNGAIRDEVPAGAAPSGIAAGRGALWVTNFYDETVSRLDPVTKSARQTIEVGRGPSGVSMGGGFVWVANSYDGTVSKVDPDTNRVADTIVVGSGPTRLTTGAGSVWVANTLEGTVSQIDMTSGAVRKTFSAGRNPTGLALGAGALWVADGSGGSVARIDPRTGRLVQTIPVGGGPSSLAFGVGSLWVANAHGTSVSRIDPETNSVVAAIPVGDGPSGIAVGAGGVWIASEFAETVSLIDPTRNEVERTTRIANRPQGLAIDDERVFVAVRASGRGHRGGTLKVLFPSPAGPVDPALTGTDFVYHGLTVYRTIGAGAAEIVPDLATSLPTPTDGGRTYTFQLRRGVRFSNGVVLRPRDVRRSIERLLRLSSPSAYQFAGIVGGAACAAKPTTCDLSRGVVENDAANTVTFHLVAPDPYFLHRVGFAAVVPASTPNRIVTTPPPATGPYMLTNQGPARGLLERNPYFREWSRAAQPDGYPDRILFRFGVPYSRGIPMVARGEADFIQVPYQLRHDVVARYQSRIASAPLPWTTYLFLNTRVPPFDDVAVRRALNYAIDRREIARLVPGAEPTCQVLPPNFPGYRPHCPYTLAPSATGGWLAPDVARARRLIASSGTGGMRVTVWWPKEDPTTGPIAPYIVSLMNRLGYRATLKRVPFDEYYAMTVDSRSRTQVGVSGWVADYPAAANFFENLLSCRSFLPANPTNQNFAGFCDARIDRQIKRALALDRSDPGAANLLWARIDRMMVDRAPWVPLFNENVAAVVSKRVANFQANFLGFVLLDQLWVR